MAKKQWYTIEVTCIKDSSALTCKKGDTLEVAKVKSKGLAFAIAQYLENVYKTEFFNIIIK